MHSQITRQHSLHLLLGILLGFCAVPAFAQTPEKDAYRAAMAHAVSEISKDPCNMGDKLDALALPVLEAGKRARAITDDVAWQLKRVADNGCANSKVQLPKVELLLTAGKRKYLDACNYSPSNDYTTALALARTVHYPAGVGVTPREFDEVPCMADFIAALLTGQAVSGAATTPSAPQPAREAPPTRRRTN